MMLMLVTKTVLLVLLVRIYNTEIKIALHIFKSVMTLTSSVNVLRVIN